MHGLIGKGSFGEVYLVEKKNTRQLHAMKVLHKSKIMSNLQILNSRAQFDQICTDREERLERHKAPFRGEASLRVSNSG